MATDTEQRLEENDDPQEVVGPEGCNATFAGTNIVVEEILNDEKDISFSAGTEISEQFVSQPIPVGIDPGDGLPRPLDDIHALPVAPPFSHRALVCMEDDREYVEIFSGEGLPYIFEDGAGSSLQSGLIFEKREEFDDLGVPAQRRKFKPEQVNGERFGFKTVEETTQDDSSVSTTKITFVRPVRLACKHYYRSVMCHDASIPFGEIGHEMMFRNCAARRSVGGAFMSLNGEAIYACELREPRDRESEIRHIEIPDRRRLTQVVENVSLFNIQAK